MVRVLVGSLVLLAGLASAVAESSARAAHEPADAKHGEKHPPKYKAEVEGKGEVTYDMQDPAHRENLTASLLNGEVHSLTADHPADLFELRWDLGIWTLVVFGLLCLILKQVAWGPMLEGLHKREQNILGAIQEAQRARTEAQALRDQLQAEMNTAQDKVRAVLDEARRDAQRLKDEMTSEATATIQAERARARREIETAKDQALQELWSQAAQLATVVSSKAIRRQLTPEDHRRLVDEALAELGTTGQAASVRV